MEIMVLLYTYAGILGLLIGSFLNVCIYRIPKKESVVVTPSHCMSCGNRLTPLDLVPVFSYLFLRGKCRKCKVKISPRYAIVEFITGCVFLALFHKFKLSVDFFAAALLMSVLIAIFFIDIDHRIIPDGLVIFALISGVPLVIYNLFKEVWIYGDRNWWTPLVGIISASGVFLLIALIGIAIYKSDDAMGMGDVKLFAPIGMFLGFKMALLALLISVVIGGLFSLLFMMLKVKGRKSTLPYGPFIVIGTFITYLYGWDIFNNIMSYYNF